MTGLHVRRFLESHSAETNHRSSRRGYSDPGDIICCCEHTRNEHRSHASGANPCKHFGCGCSDFEKDDAEILRQALVVIRAFCEGPSA